MDTDRVPVEYIGDDTGPFQEFVNGVGFVEINPAEETVYHFPAGSVDWLLQHAAHNWAEWTGKPRRIVRIAPDELE